MYTTANKYGRNLLKNNNRGLFGGICNPAGGEQRIFNPLRGYNHEVLATEWEPEGQA